MASTEQNAARVVVLGATGNVGTSVVTALAADPRVASILGVARRRPQWSAPRTEWAQADIKHDDLVSLFRGADVVIHLAWLIQPTHSPLITWRTNVEGTLRVFRAAAKAGVAAVVYASSVGAYSPGPKDAAVTEDWPTDGWPTASYTREKAYVERSLDAFERGHPDIRVVRLRPGFIFKRESASGQRRLFIGPFLPNQLVRPGLVPIVPDLPGLRFQAVHTADIAEAYRLAALSEVRGAFNIAAEPVVDAALLADIFGARVVSLPRWPVRAAVWLAWQMHLVPASPYLFDAFMRLPIMDTSRARTELGWTPRYSSREALEEFLGGLRDGAGMPTPPLAPRVPGGRAHEVRTGVGVRP
ncbi:MAG TPA: NAD-dependent epimerase/dehydratase family protein [Pseudonocardiaceae bacterium]|nr:NAD-dependent epimerase/dehydratase family protein [Pseudonocardiaceae bacterium]